MPDHPGPRILFVETLRSPDQYPEQQARHAYLAAYMLENATGHSRKLILCQEPRERA